MAGTVLLPVRGRRRVEALGALLISGSATGAAIGALSGLALGWLPAPSTVAVVVVVVAAAALDIAHRWGLRALDIGRQVPLAWGRLFSPTTSAVLYGARLGVGPATILTSWTWWAAIVLGGLAGPLVGASVGVLFHVSRVVTMIAATTGGAGATRMALLDRLDSPTRSACVAATLATAVGAAL